MGLTIDPTAVIDCETFEPGDETIIRAHARITGRHVKLGRQSFIDEFAVIGGGQAGVLVTGDWFHLGMFAQVNTTRPVRIGDEVGLGIGTRVFTHGAYLSELDGFPYDTAPVEIGDRAWLPNAIILPGVHIGSDTVVMAGSVVTHDLPSGCLAGGTPASVIEKDCYPTPIADPRPALRSICDEAGAGYVQSDGTVWVNATRFDPQARTITGPASPITDRVRDQLRRHGIRFPYTADHERWKP